MIRFALLISLVLVSVSTYAAEPLAVIVNESNAEIALSKGDVADLYMGRSRTFPDGQYALVFDRERGNTLRGTFYQFLTGLSTQQVDKYWSRLLFTGQVLPLYTLKNDKMVIDLVSRNPSAIGYVQMSSVADVPGVRVLMLLEM